MGTMCSRCFIWHILQTNLAFSIHSTTHNPDKKLSNSEMSLMSNFSCHFCQKSLYFFVLLAGWNGFQWLLRKMKSSPYCVSANKSKVFTWLRLPSTNSFKKKIRGGDFKICAGYSFRHGWFSSLWAIRCATPPL